MKSIEQLQLELEINLGLTKELSGKMLQIRGILEEKLVKYPLYESIESGANAMLEGFGCNLNGEFKVDDRNAFDEFGGEYNLRLSADCFERLTENPLEVLIDRDITITGYATGFGSIDYVLVTLSSIKRLGHDGLRELQDKLVEVEFLLKTIGLILDEEIDSEEDVVGSVKFHRPKRVREI